MKGDLTDMDKQVTSLNNQVGGARKTLKKPATPVGIAAILFLLFHH